MQLFLSLEHLEATVGLLIGLISILLCLREQGGLRRGRQMGEQLVGRAVRTHTFIHSVHDLTWVQFTVPKTITIVTSKITDHIAPSQMQYFKHFHYF